MRTTTTDTEPTLDEIRATAKGALDARGLRARVLIARAAKETDPLTADRLLTEAASCLIARTMTEKVDLSRLSHAETRLRSERGSKAAEKVGKRHRVKRSALPRS